jgi:hypothetical protein
MSAPSEREPPATADEQDSEGRGRETRTDRVAPPVLAAGTLLFFGVTIGGFLAQPLEAPHAWLLFPVGCTIVLALAWLWRRDPEPSPAPDHDPATSTSNTEGFANALAASAGAGALLLISLAVDEGALIGSPLLICLVVSVAGVTTYVVTLFMHHRRRRFWLTALVSGEVAAYVEWPFRRLRPHVAAVGAAVATVGAIGVLQVVPRHHAIDELTGDWRVANYSILSSSGWTTTQRWEGETWRLARPHGCHAPKCGYVVISSYEAPFRLYRHGDILAGSRYVKSTCAALQSNGAYLVTAPVLGRAREEITVIAPERPGVTEPLTIVRSVQGESTPESERQGCRVSGRAQLMSLAKRN